MLAVRAEFYRLFPETKVSWRISQGIEGKG